RLFPHPLHRSVSPVTHKMNLALLAALAVAAPPAAHAATNARAPYANIFVADTHGKILRRLTDNRLRADSFAYDPSWPRDARHILFTESPCENCRSEIRTLDLRAPRDAWAGTLLGYGFHPRLSHDGRTIAYVGLDGGIFTMRADGSARRLVVRNDAAGGVSV